MSVIDYNIKPNPFSVLIHGDICPDNVFDHKNTKNLQLIDFEWSFVRNALLDGTYLRMSMPTCWCARAISPHLIDPLEELYREELKRTVPAAMDDKEYYKAYTYACGFWALQSISLIDSVWDNDRVSSCGPVSADSLWKPEENWVRPRILSRLKAFIDTAKLYHHVPTMKNMALAMLARLQERWPDAKFLQVYPAFSSAL